MPVVVVGTLASSAPSRKLAQGWPVRVLGLCQTLPVSRATGALLYMLARSCRARSIVEFGTSFGISTLHLAAALRDNGGGRLITTEFEPSKIARARANLMEGGVMDLVEIRAGDDERGFVGRGLVRAGGHGGLHGELEQFLVVVRTRLGEVVHGLDRDRRSNQDRQHARRQGAHPRILLPRPLTHGGP